MNRTRILPPDHDVLAMIERDRLSQAVIARKFGVTSAAVSKSVWKAREGLVPAWVPREFRRLYAEIAHEQDEFEAAAECRRLKREIAA